MKRINQIYEYKKDTKNNEWISNDEESIFCNEGRISD